jgi:hypothetical protein
MRRGLLACLLCAAGCSEPPYALYYPFAHSPREPNTSLSGYPAVRYAIPRGDPHGEVAVASFGVVWLDVWRYGPVRAVQARLLVENKDDVEPWEIDARRMRAVFPSGAEVPVALVNASAPGVPVVKLPPGREVGIDGYFLVPPGFQESVTAFAIVWSVNTGAGFVTERTPFTRLLEPAATRAERFGYGLGFLPHWWFGPLFFRPNVFAAHPPRVFVVERPRLRWR